MRVPELLAPAANLSCAQAAFDHGADAVYAGLSTYNLRAHSANFDLDELCDLRRLGHDIQKRVFVALNVMPNDSMIADIERSLQSLAKRSCRPDAFIVGDPGVVSLCQQYFPDIPLHLSTQTGTFNTASALFWARFGVKRVILPREMTLDAVRAIASLTKLETEVFIHGAMCVSVSGRCLLGAYLGKRHANFGDCPQPCRLRYRIAPFHGDASDEAVPGAEWHTVEEDFSGIASILNSKDLNTLPILDRIALSGVSSVKIEGRNRSLHYVASVVKVYRAALDAIADGIEKYTVSPQWREELDRLDHRPYTTGFYGGEYVLQDFYDKRRMDGFRVVGIVREEFNDTGAVVDVKNPFSPLDTVNVLAFNRDSMTYDATVVRITDVNGNEIGKALTNRLVVCTTVPQIRVGDILRKKQNPA